LEINRACYCSANFKPAGCAGVCEKIIFDDSSSEGVTQSSEIIPNADKKCPAFLNLCDGKKLTCPKIKAVCSNRITKRILQE